MKHVENSTLNEDDIVRILDNIPLNVIVTDINGKILWCNQTACDFTGYKQKELKGENPRILKCENTEPKIYKEMWETIAVKKEIWTGIITSKKKNGELYEEELRIIPIFDKEGNINKFIGIQRDVTELDKLRKREKVKDAIKKAVEKIEKINNR